MSDQITAVGGTAYAPPVHHAALAECLACVLAGEPLPEAFRPPAPSIARPATVREGIERILGAGR